MSDQAEIHKKTISKSFIERRWGVKQLINKLEDLPDKKQACEDLILLMRDNDRAVQMRAANALIDFFPYIDNKNQICMELINLIKITKDRFVLRELIKSLFAIFPYTPDKRPAWDYLIKLIRQTMAYDKVIIHRMAIELLFTILPYIPFKEQAWEELIKFMQTRSLHSSYDRSVDAVIAFFPYVPDKKRACDDLHRLTSDTDSDVRASAYHSLGKVSIFKAANAQNDIDLKKEMEAAIGYFEKSLQQRSWYRSAKFCLSFYRSFYILTFKKEKTEVEVQKYIAEAKSHVAGSKSKEKLIEAVENLGNALREVEKTRDISDIRTNLNAYKRYCDRACELLETTDEKAPGASRLIRRGLPIIDERIKGIIAEIQRHAKEIYTHTQDTPLKDFGIKTCNQAHELSLQNPLDLDIGLGRIINTAKDWCEYIKHDSKKKSVCEKLRSLENLDIREKVIIISEVFEDISTNLYVPRIQKVHICDTQEEIVRVAVIQFCYQLTKSFPFVIVNKDAVKAKLFSGLDIAKNKGANITCLPELCLCEAWIPEINMKYKDMIIIGGGYYRDNSNICPVMMKSEVDLPPQSKITPAAPEDLEMWESGMIPGDRIYRYETQFGKFVILICRDFERFAHYFREIDIDFIFCPSFNDANERFHVEANNHVTKTPSYILIANTGVFGGSSIFAQLNKNQFSRLVGEGCKDDGDMSFKLCEAKKGKDDVLIADFNIIHKSIQIPAPSESSKEKRSVTHIKKLQIP